MKKKDRIRTLNNIQRKYNVDFSISGEAYQSIEYFVDWTKVKCYDGYCIYNPEKTIGRVLIDPIRIVVPNVTESTTEIVKKYSNRLPRLKWKIDKYFNLVFLEEELFINAIPNLIKELEDEKNDKTPKVIKNSNIAITINNKKYNFQEYNIFVEQKIIEQKSKHLDSNIFSENHTLDWKYIIFLDGYLIILPIIKGLFIKPLIIRKTNSKKLFNNYISRNKEQFLNISITVNNNFNIEQVDNAILNKHISKLASKSYKQLTDTDEKRNESKISALFSKTFTVDWKDIYFCKNYYTFDPNYNKSLSKHKIERLYINDTRSRESFNFIIKYLMKRMPIIHYQITENFTIKLLDTPLLEVAINFLVKEQAKYDIGVGEIAEATGRILNAEKLTFASAMSKAANMRPEDFKKYKSQFINYLIFQQHKEYKVVPMSESITHSNITFEEATFIFTVKSWDNNLLLIIENVNPDRSTIIFKVYPNQYKDALQTIFDFMQSNLVNKRSSIRENSLTFSNCGIIKYWSCNHDSFNDWRERMGRHIDNH